VAITAGIAGAVAYVRRQKMRTETTSSVAPPVTVSTQPVAIASPSIALPSSTPSAAAPAPIDAGVTAPPSSASASAAQSDASSAVIAEGTGVLKTAGTAPGRRIFVDEKTLGQTPEAVTVKCGKHSVRLGSTGKPQAVEVPCGGEVTIADKF
jgi:serine/threonine-protein kinase